jgi:hypothetical protein
MHDKVAQYSLIELMQDPLIGIVMKSDGVDRRSIERLFERLACERLRPSRETVPCTHC